MRGKFGSPDTKFGSRRGNFGVRSIRLKALRGNFDVINLSTGSVRARVEAFRTIAEVNSLEANTKRSNRNIACQNCNTLLF